jgi:hypothetical protein
MDLGLLLLGLVAFVLGLLVLRVLMRMVAERDAALHDEPKPIIVVPDGTITRLSHG